MMPPDGKKNCPSLPSDILSDLPNNVIDVILMCLPCKDAVRTSILSKKWRYHWCRLTELTLDASLWETTKDVLDPTVRFSKIIYELFSQHKGPITKFTLNIAHLRRFPEIDYLIYFLSRTGIQHLILQFQRFEEYSRDRVPFSLFSCSQLRHLTLHDCVMHAPSAFKGSFDRLISLTLYRVSTSSNLLTSLISQSPLLEQLILKVVKFGNTIEINAPMLRYLKYKGRFWSICLKNVPLLSKLTLKRVRSDSIKPENFNVAKFFESCSSLENLRLQFFYFEMHEVTLAKVPRRLPFDLNRVKRFNLPNIVLDDSHKLSCVLCLLRSFPNLEYFEIQVYSEEDTGVQCSLELEHFSDVTFNHLREVKLKWFSGTTPEMQLIELFLAKSPELKKIIISDEFPDTRLEVLAKISNFFHASPEAKVVYLS